MKDGKKDVKPNGSGGNQDVRPRGDGEGEGTSDVMGSPATRILKAWIRLEDVLRSALPVCSVQPPTQPAELLSALRINHQIGQDQETRILALREIRNRTAHSPEEPPADEANRFEREAETLMTAIRKEEEAC
jgi:hypothetical protein